MQPIPPAVFVVVWEQSNSLTEAEVRLRRAGHPMTVNELLMFAHVLRRFGTDLKEMPRGDLPDFCEIPSESPEPPGPRRPPPLLDPYFREPVSVSQEDYAAQEARLDRHSRGADARYDRFYLKERWAYREGSLG